MKFLVNFTLLKYVKYQRSYGFLITKELIFGFQILDLKGHFSASSNKNQQQPDPQKWRLLYGFLLYFSFHYLVLACGLGDD